MTSKKRWPATLGDTVEEIAESLRKQGARGIPGCRSNCIIARSYKISCPNGWPGLKAHWYKNTNGTFGCSLNFFDPQIWDPTGSPALGEFMHLFDEGKFPDLICKPIPKAEDVLSNMFPEDRIAIGK